MLQHKYEPDVPTAETVVLHATHTGNNLQCHTSKGDVRCQNANMGKWEQLRFRPHTGTAAGSWYIIQSMRNGKNLQCHRNGAVGFVNTNEARMSNAGATPQ